MVDDIFSGRPRKEKRKSNNNFKPVYKTLYSMQGTMANITMPNHMDQLMKGVYLFELKKKEGILMVIASLSSIVPIYSKYLRRYQEINQELETCKKMRDEWLHTYKGRFYPLELSQKIYCLYEKVAYDLNACGALMAGQQVNTNIEKQRYDAIVGNPPSQDDYLDQFD